MAAVRTQCQPIQLATVNARYPHSAFGLRCLWSNLGDLRPLAAVREFTGRDGADRIADALLAARPRAIGLGVYIWNVAILNEVARSLRRRAPEVAIVVGGPEVSHEHETSELVALADVLVRGEAELAFAEVAAGLLDRRPPAARIVSAPPPDLDRLELPYGAYSDEDIGHRILYVESARGCPFGCEFCLSSLDRCVRAVPLAPFFQAMARLIDRGGRRFKFVDRSFNIDVPRAVEILRFFHQRWRDGMQVHLELVPDRIDRELLDAMARFPPNALHLEVGIQSFNEPALRAVGRRQDVALAERNLSLLQQTGAALHADLLVGLPGEDWASFAAGFDRLIARRPPELQIEILKRLRGTAIDRHPGLRFATEPPYELLCSDALDSAQVQRIKRCARYLDLLYNSGNFPRSLEWLWRCDRSPWAALVALSDAIWSNLGAVHSIPLATLAEQLFGFLVGRGVADRRTIGDAIDRDYHRLAGRRDRLAFLSRG
ncbi:MAG: DUF4080 domain-containing protein [Deltaproteobacteria bacterium]|nr:DUF4080 domain-containing protein [Deltaproteobacteria bacterium]